MTFFLRALLLITLGGGFALAVAPGPMLAQEQNAVPPAGSQTPSPPDKGSPGSGATRPLFDPSARIKYLHDRLRITAEQEAPWDAVAKAIRDSARDIVPLLRERLRARTSGSALDVLHSQEALGEFRLAALKSFIVAFDPLYAALSEPQKKIADAILREGLVNTIESGVPGIAAPFGAFGAVLPYPLAVPFYGPLLRGGPERALLPRRAAPLRYLPGLVLPGRAAIAGRHFGGLRR